MTDLGRFRAIVFDFDGVIVDSETMQARAWNRVADELGMRDCLITVQRIAGRLDRDLAAELFPTGDASWCVEQKARIEAELEAAGELRLVEGVERFVRGLAARHVLGICSNCPTDVLARRLERVGLASMFAVVVGRTDALRAKPAP